jgi:hypothetical protein
LFFLLATPSACVGTSLELHRHHPADPNAPAPAIPDPPPTLRSGFDPGGAAVSAPAAGEHDHHQHHQHDHHQHQHHPEPGRADGGAP